MCGVFGVFGHEEAARLTYMGLHALQHRGEESAGIAAAGEGRLRVFKRLGRVADVFDEARVAALSGDAAVGHVRYATAGGASQRNSQPLVVELGGAGAAGADGAGLPLAVAHNGHLTNAKALRRALAAEGVVFHTSGDTEALVHLLARETSATAEAELSPRAGLVARLRRALAQVEGAYSLVLLTPDELVAVRDPRGFRPLVLGRVGEGWVVASETCAVRCVGGQVVGEVEPGEIVRVGRGGGGAAELRRLRLRTGEGGEGGEGANRTQGAPAALARCVFEQIYFARPDSEVFGAGVYAARRAIGRQLGREAPVPGADVVVPVPDSGAPAALGYAAEVGLPFERGILRSADAGRTFIQPSPATRHLAVRLKLSPVEHVLRGRSVVVVDDSIVRGTTAREIVQMARQAGAREVHLRVASPPTVWPCHFGIDTPSRGELLAAGRDEDQVAATLGADSVAYVSLSGLWEALPSPRPEETGGEGARDTRAGGEPAGAAGHPGWCAACFDGAYPAPVPDAENSQHDR